MFYYYGGKRRLASKYPEPQFDTIVEPFAGAAGYALLHFERDTIFIEQNPRVVALWRYLQRASTADILSLPLLGAGERVDGRGLSEPEQDLIRAHAAPGARVGYIVGRFSKWNERKRAEIAAAVHLIRKWTIIEGDYTAAPDIEATWFIDPPYQFGGKHYPGTKPLDRAALLKWCNTRQGQVIVCEDDRNTWLPETQPIAMNKNIQNAARRREVMYERGHLRLLSQ